MRMKMAYVYSTSSLLLCVALLRFGVGPRKGEAEQLPRYLPPAGAVPDSTTAVRIAEAVLAPVVGQETVDEEKPFTATLKGDVWTVQGTMPKGFACGGVGVVQISKKRGCILTLVHYK